MAQPAKLKLDTFGLKDLDDAAQLALSAAIIESSDDAIISKSLDGVVQSWNAGATRTFGYSPQEMIGRSITVIIPPDLRSEEELILGRIRRGERIEHFDTIRVTKDGRLVPVSLTISPVRNASGVIIGASKIARDISERKRVEEALRNGEQRLLSEAASLAKLNEWSSRLWHCRTLNEGLEVILGAVIELLGADQGNLRLFDPKRNTLTIAAQSGFSPAFTEEFRETTLGDSERMRAVRSGERIIVEDVDSDARFEIYRPVARAGGYRAIVSTPLLGADGALLGIVSAHFRAVTRPEEQELRRMDLYLRQASDFIQRTEIEERLRRSEEALRDADRRKDEFLALLAHELRNPLAPIRYALAACKKPGSTADQWRRAEDVIERQVMHMSRLLDDLLDVSRITRGTLELKKSHIELTSVLGAAIEAARPILDAKQHTLSLDLPHEAVRLEADPIRLAQVFSNLLINAAKYTDPGGRIELSAVRDKDCVTVSVRDNGIGIASEMMPRLFAMFSQAHNAITRSEGGLGVGLSLVRGLVTLHGGSVDVRSEGANRGSEFTVRLPLGEIASETVRAHAKSPHHSPVGTGFNILIVDDNRDAVETCAMLLELSGHRVKVAYTGRSALELAESFHPDVCLLDIGLPDISGYELAAQIRAAAWGRDATLVALTGWGQEDDKRRALDAGFDLHLTKPIAADRLEALLNSIEPFTAESARA